LDHDNRQKAIEHRQDALRKRSKRKAAKSELVEDDGPSEDLQQPNFHLLRQPVSMKFGKLQTHQLDALKWMASLAENKMNGILADDMGLGKTIMAISILCYVWD